MLPNTISVFIIFAFIVSVNFVVILGQVSSNSGLKIGENCDFNETIKGVCGKADNCDYIKDNPKFRKNMPDDIKSSLCLSRGRNQLVCCPSLFNPQDLQIDEIKYSKFEKATCKDKEPQWAIITNIVSDLYAEVGEFQFQALIGYKNKVQTSNSNVNYSFSCGGALIADDIVITSAYCLRYPAKPAVVKVGATSFDFDTDDHSVSEIIEIEYSIPHSNYSMYTNANDIGLIKLKRPYDKKSWSISPICLSTHDEDLPKNFTITGYGINSRIHSTATPWLLKQISNIQPNSNYQNEFRKKRLKIFDSQACVVAFNETESCIGDLGGPMIYEKNFKNTIGEPDLTYLYGIKSRGFGCNSSLPSIYTKIFPYIKWIEETMEELERSNNKKDNDPIIWN